MSAGAFGPEKPVDDDVKAITDSAEVVAAVAGLLGTAVASLTTTSYSSQVVRDLPNPWEPPHFLELPLINFIVFIRAGRGAELQHQRS